MSNIHTDQYTPETIQKIYFSIPLYQRPYAWGKFQVEQLLKDLFEQYEKDKTQYYYIGILSIGNKEGNGIYDLIDGQQRITTLILIGKALADRFSDWNLFVDNRLQFYGREEDQIYLDKLDTSLNPNPKMVEAIETAKRFIEKKDEGFIRFIYQKTAFFLAEIPSHYSLIEKNLHFVRMNNRGKQLEAYDILKVKLASWIKKEDKNNFFKKWNQISQLGCESVELEENNEVSLFDILASETQEKLIKEQEIFYKSILSFPEFLLIALDRFINLNSTLELRKIKINHSKEKLLEEFGFGSKDVGFKWDEENVKSFIDFLEIQYHHFDYFIIKRDREENYLFRVAKTDSSEQYITGESYSKLRQFQAFLYVAHESDPHKWLISTFNFLQKYVADNKIEAINSNIFLDKLKEFDNESCKQKNSVSFDYFSFDRYWFWRLDYYLWEKRNTSIFNERSLKIAEKYTFRTNRSIEHIAPQNPSGSTNVQIIESLKHCFGNLAMISSGQNSSLQNKPFEIKRAHVESFINGSKSGTIESLKMLDIYDYSIWNEENLKKHSDKMINVLIQSFPEEYEKIVSVLNNHLYINYEVK